MGLLGRGALMNWGGVVADQESDYNAWHSLEHMPERLAVPGFRRGRRGVGVEGTAAEHKYFMMYEAEDIEVFVSPLYLDRLNAPTPWTRRILSAYVAPSRTVCRVRESRGRGVGGWNATIQFAESWIPPTGLLDQIAGLAGVLGIHVLDGDAGLGQQPTAEKTLRESRGDRDRTVSTALLIDAMDRETAETALNRAVAAARPQLGGIIATIYAMQHVVVAEDAR